MWINVRDQKPQKDGVYLTQMMHGGLAGLEYTQEGGWNTHYDSDGSLCNQSVISDNRIARWFDAPEPPEIPDKCFLEMQKVGGADEEAERIADGMTPASSPMTYGDTYVEVEEIK